MIATVAAVAAIVSAFAAVLAVACAIITWHLADDVLKDQQRRLKLRILREKTAKRRMIP